MNDIYKLLLDSIPFPIWIKSLDLNFIYVNNKYVQDNENKKREDFIGYKNEDIFSPYFCNRYITYCKKVIETRKIEVREMNINDKYNQCAIIPLINDKDELIAIAGIICKSYQQEKDMEIEMQKNLTKHIIDLLPGVVFYKDKESKYVYANKECRDFYSKKGVNNIYGKNDGDINLDKKLSQKFLEDDKKIINNKETISNESIFIHEDGSKEYREVVKVPLVDSKGEVHGIVGRSINVTKQREAEERLKYLSYTDILTGINNRTKFEERVEELSKEKYLPLGLIMGDANGLKLVNDNMGHQEGDKLLKAVAKIMSEACDGIGEVFRIGGDEFVILIPNTNRKYCEGLINRIYDKCNETENDIFKISIALGAAIRQNIDKPMFKVLKDAEDKVYRQKLVQDKSIKSSILNTLKTGLGTKSQETKEHTGRVSLNAVKVGEKLELEMSEIVELRIVGEIHDIGKIGINEEVLEKPGRLTSEEYEIMKTHSEKGYTIIKISNELSNVANGILYHHEKWDGTGYPMGLKGKEIPLISRIISVADAYDVMTNERVYKRAICKEDAIKELIRCSGTQFDPEIVEVFIQCISE